MKVKCIIVIMKVKMKFKFISVMQRIVIVDPGLLITNLLPPSKLLELILLSRLFISTIILKVIGTMLFPQILIIMNKNIIIIVLSLLLIGSCVALHHVTHRLDVASALITEFEDTYPDHLDTVAENDTYYEWYNF